MLTDNKKIEKRDKENKINKVESSEKEEKNNDGSGKSIKINIKETINNIRDAVVLVSGVVIVNNEINKISTGNGYFIKGHYIICTSNIILIPTIKEIKRCDKILVDVSNVNGEDKSYSYEGDLIGIDGVSNIAIIKINNEKEENKLNPGIRTEHPVLQWGKSRNSSPGTKVLIIGNIINNKRLTTENAVITSIISDNRFVYPGGEVTGELLLLSKICKQNGLPILTYDGKLIGMIINIEKEKELTVGLSEFFMRKSVRLLIRTYQEGINDNKGFIQCVNNVPDPYLKFNKSYLGLVGTLVTQIDYYNKIDYYNNQIINKIEDDHHYTNNDDIQLNISKFISIDSSREIVGYKILAIAGDINNDNIGYLPYKKPSPLLNILQSGDIIISISDCKLGDRKCQISPSLVMWRIPPNDIVKIIYKRKLDNYTKIYQVHVKTNNYENILDFPYYSYDKMSYLNLLIPFV